VLKQNHYGLGLLVSLLLHAMLFLIPVSMAVFKPAVRHYSVIEISMVEERPVAQLQEPAVEVKPQAFQVPQQRLQETKEVVARQRIAKEVKPRPVITSTVMRPSPVETRVETENEASVPEVMESANSAGEAEPVARAPVAGADASHITGESAPFNQVLNTEFGSGNAPKFLHREMPIYPLIARRLGKEARVVLRLTIDEKGNLLNVEVIEGAGYGFTEAAVEAVRRSTFTPAEVNGKAVMSKAILPIKFSLRSEGSD